MTSRRGFLLGLGAALAAPSIVRAESLMKLWVPPAPVLRPYPLPDPRLIELLNHFERVKHEVWTRYGVYNVQKTFVLPRGLEE